MSVDTIVSTIANSVSRVQAPAKRLRSQVPAATHADLVRTPVDVADESTRTALAASWGWS
jgi:hypothetical protein